MPRPKKVPALPAPDLSAVNQILAKARSIVATSGKRKGPSDDLEPVEDPTSDQTKGGWVCDQSSAHVSTIQVTSIITTTAPYNSPIRCWISWFNKIHEP